MRNVTYIGIVIAMIFSGCVSQKKLQTETPFVLGAVTGQKWIGGMEQSGTGYELAIPVSNMSIQKVDLLEVYFRGKVTRVIIEENENVIMAVAKYYSAKPDIIMHADPKQEVGNQPPTLDKKGAKAFPFDLKTNEAILSYLEKDKLKYVKITQVKEKAPKIYPAAKPQD
ncbi:MAG: hypothetical protein COA50_04365 [Flavobacteriaceae bacterium]|nr:MAG: hypothetical protein COA50_04365 [Flavobacteriaceae bacterium]